MNEYTSLDDFKKKQMISDSKNHNISIIFNEIFNEYYYNHAYGKEKKEQEKRKNLLIKKLLEECKEVNPTLIPYEKITNVIFAEYEGYDNDSPFVERFKNEYEKYIINNFSFKPLENTERSLKIIKNDDKVSHMKNLINKDDENAILVIYKIIQHTELAISQKQSLYENLKNDINYLDSNVFDATNKYDNMMSNFISILGIFAAIMMATFGAIQGFSAIYSNENNYNFATIILISCFGLFALISILYILLYSISKLVDKELRNVNYYHSNVFTKYHVYSHTMLIIFIENLLSLTHLLKSNSTCYVPNHLVDNLWWYTILVSVFILGIYYIHNLISQSNGYWHINRHMNDQIMNIKVIIGLKKMLNIIWLTITIVFV